MRLMTSKKTQRINNPRPANKKGNIYRHTNTNKITGINNPFSLISLNISVLNSQIKKKRETNRMDEETEGTSLLLNPEQAS